MQFLKFTNILYVWQPYIFFHIYGHSSFPCLVDIPIYLIYVITLVTIHTCVFVHNAYAHEVLHKSYKYFTVGDHMFLQFMIT